MQASEVQTKLQAIHLNIGLHDEPLIMDQTFRSQGYDSLDDVEFFIHAEKAFGVSIDDELLSNVQTPNDVVELIITAHTPTSPETAPPASA